MNPHAQIAAALGGAFIVLFFAGGWLNDVQQWVYLVTQRPGSGPDVSQQPGLLRPTAPWGGGA